MAEAGSVPDKYTLQAFRLKEQDALSQVSKVIGRSFEQKIKNKLIVLGYEDDELDEVTKEVLYEGVEIYENSDDQSEDVQELNHLQEIHSGLFDRAVLILFINLNFPLGNMEKELQDGTFCELYPDITTNAEKNPKEIVQATSYSEIKIAIKVFINKFSMRSKKIVLIFRGEGALQSLDRLEATGMSKMIEEIREFLNQDRQKHDLGVPQLPQTMDIVIEKKGYIEVLPLHCLDTPSVLSKDKKIVLTMGPKLVNGYVHEQGKTDFEVPMELDDKDQGTELTCVTSEPW